MFRHLVFNTLGRRLTPAALTAHVTPSFSLSRRTLQPAVALYSTRPLPVQADSLIDIGTRRIFNEDHDLFREMCRRFAQEEVKPHHERWEEEGQISRECWLKAGENGMLGITVPEQYGGSGGDVLFANIVWEELAYANCSGPGFSLHSDIVCPYILHYGTEEQKARILPKLCSGEWIGAIAMSEPAAGSDLAGVKSQAVKKGDKYILNGSKTFITNGQMSDVVIVVAKTDPSKGAHGVSLFLVERGMPGFERGRNLKKMGLKAQDTSELFFDNVELPATALLGEENKGFYYLMQELPQERLLIAGIAVANAEAMFEITRTYVKDRHAFGKPLLNNQVIRHQLADAKTDLAVGRAFYDQCLELHNEKRLDSATASMVKMWMSDLQSKTADLCVQLHGGYGYCWETEVCKAYVDARVQRIYGGTNEIMKELIARDL